MEIKLAPCPFCGGIPTIVYCEEGCCNSLPRMIECECGASLCPCKGSWSDDTKAIYAWNKRIDSGENINIIQKAIDISKKAHEGQKRWDGSDYFENHILKVVSNVKQMEGISTTGLVCTAYLHDVVEDTNVTFEELSADFLPEVIDALKLLTRNKSESYFDFTMKIINSDNYLAKIVKIADLKANMADTKDKTTRMYATYQFALYLLENS